MTIIRLHDIDDTRLDVYTSLTNHQLRNALDPKRGIVIVESEIAIRVALAHGVAAESFLLDERKLQSMDDVLETLPSDVPVFVLPPDIAEKLTGYRVTRGALCAMRRPSQPSVRDLLASSRRVVVLEGITDTSNVGAVFRNAAALGADALVVSPTCADPLSRRSVRVSMGNVFLLPWVRAQGPWPTTLANELHTLGFDCLALALDDDACNLDHVGRSKSGRRALFFGSEGTGLDAQTIAACDRTVVIPMRRGVDSLNVAASSAVAMWELFNKE